MTNEVAVYEDNTPTDLTIPANRKLAVDGLEAQVLLVQEAMDRVLEKGVHYGTIPGTQRPSLWQPGAELICQLFQFKTEMERTDQYEDWDKKIFSYTYRCRLLNRNGDLITERESTCSSQEKQYARNPNPAEIRQTLMLMAEKRAYVAAVRAAGACSAIFTQDDDIVPRQTPQKQRREPEEDEGYGICKVHNVPFFQTVNMKSPAHKFGDNQWCNLWMAASDPVAEARIKARDMLESLVGRGQEFANARANYVEDVLGKEHNTLSFGDVTAEDWERVMDSAAGDLQMKEMNEEMQQQMDMDPDYGDERDI